MSEQTNTRDLDTQLHIAEGVAEELRRDLAEARSALKVAEGQRDAELKACYALRADYERDVAALQGHVRAADQRTSDHVFSLKTERAAHAETRKALERALDDAKTERCNREAQSEAASRSKWAMYEANEAADKAQKDRDALKAELATVRAEQLHPWRFAVEWGVEGSRARCVCFRFERDANNYIACGMAGYAPKVVDLGPAPTATEAGKGEPIRDGAVSERARLIYEGVVAIRVVSPIACPGTIGGCVDEAVQILRAAEAEATNGVGGEGRA